MPAPAGRDRPLRSLAGREPALPRDPRPRSLPQRPRDLGAPDVARRLLPLLVGGAAPLLPRLPHRPRAGQPRAPRARSRPARPDRRGAVRRARRSCRRTGRGSPPAAAGERRLLFGGLYDWYDPWTAARRARARSSDLRWRLLFDPQPEPPTHAAALFGEVEARCRRSGWWGSRVELLDWVPVERRYDLLRDVDAPGGAAPADASRRGSRCAPASSTRWPPAARWSPATAAPIGRLLARARRRLGGAAGRRRRRSPRRCARRSSVARPHASARAERGAGARARVRLGPRARAARARSADAPAASIRPRSASRSARRPSRRADRCLASASRRRLAARCRARPCGVGVRPPREPAARSPSSPGTAGAHLETCLDALAAQRDPGASTGRSWSSTTARPTAPPSGCARRPQPRRPRVRLDRRAPSQPRLLRRQQPAGRRAPPSRRGRLPQQRHAAATPDWLAALVDALAGAPTDVAAVSGLIVDWEGERLDFGRGVMTFDGHAFQLDFRRPLGRRSVPAAGDELLFACGGNMLVRRDALPRGRRLRRPTTSPTSRTSTSAGACGRAASGCCLRAGRASSTTARARRATCSGLYNRGFLFERNAFLTAYKNYEPALWERLMPAVLLTLLARTQTLLVQNNPGGAELATRSVRRRQRSPRRADRPSVLDRLRRRGLSASLQGAVRSRASSGGGVARAGAATQEGAARRPAIAGAAPGGEQPARRPRLLGSRPRARPGSSAACRRGDLRALSALPRSHLPRRRGAVRGSGLPRLAPPRDHARRASPSAS